MPALNIPPIRPINSPGRNIRPINNNLKGVGSISSKPKGAFDSLDIEEIGKGSLMTEGSYHKRFGDIGGKRYSGLKGQLMKIRKAGRHTVTKNISMRNIRQMHDLIAGRLKKKIVGSQTYISRRDKMAILKEARGLVKTKSSKFTWQDREDLGKIVNTMQKQYKDKILHRGNSADIPSIAGSSSSLNNKDVIGAQPLNPPERNNFAGSDKLPSKLGSNNLSAPSDDAVKLRDLKNFEEDLIK